MIAISILASPKLASRFAELYPGQGSIDALKQIAIAGRSTPSSPAISALTTLASEEKGNDSSPARAALASVLRGKEKSIVQFLTAENRKCNGFIVDAAHGWAVTAAYCLNGVAPKEVTVQTSDGRRLDVRDIRLNETSLLAFAEVNGSLPQPVDISDKVFHVGDSITQVAFDMTAEKSSPSDRILVTVGQIIGIKSVPFASPYNKEAVSNAFIVTLPTQKSGTGGSPLFDNEGNVACMTYQGTFHTEQCVPADEIRKGLARVLSFPFN